VGMSTRKELKLLELSAEQMKHTLILDDVKVVWEDAQQERVLTSKKFIPLKEFMDPKKYEMFYFYHDKKQNRLTIEDIGLYEETNIKGKDSQLRDLADFLETLARKFNAMSLSYDVNHPKLDTKELCKTQMSLILKGCVIRVLSTSMDRICLFTQIASTLGAQPTFVDDPTHVLVDNGKYVNREIENQVGEFKRRGNAKILTINWLMQSYFALRKKTSTPFIYSNN